MFKRFLNYINTFFLIVSVLPLFIYGLDYEYWFYIILFIASMISIIVSYYNKLYENKMILFIDILGAISLLSTIGVLVLLRLVRLFSVVRRLESMKILVYLFKHNIKILWFLLQIILLYIVITSVIMFNIEPETFDYSYFTSFYWSAITLTTIGYGDYAPVTQLGQFITVISSILGIGVIALPTGLFASGFVEYYNSVHKNK